MKMPVISKDALIEYANGGPEQFSPEILNAEQPELPIPLMIMATSMSNASGFEAYLLGFKFAYCIIKNELRIQEDKELNELFKLERL